MLGNTGLLAAGLVIAPFFGQIKFAIHQYMAMPARIGQKHADLAVFDPTRGTTVLAGNARRVAPLFEKDGLIDNQYGIRSPWMVHNIGTQLVADGIRMPKNTPQQVR
jgi:hypothetical protein